MSSRSPRYLNVAAVLQDEINLLAPNSLLPTEQQLAKRFGVSRITVRGALDLLEKSGLVSRLRGRGTTVSPPKITRHFSPLQSFEQDLDDQKIEFETRVLSYDSTATAPEFILDRLRLPSNGTVGYLSLTRLVDDRVVCHDARYYPPDVANKMDPERVVEHDASKVLEDIVDSRIAQVDWESEIISAFGEVSEALGTAPRTLILANTYTWHSEFGVPIEAGVISYRIDRCKFRYETSFHQATPRRRKNAQPSA
jgi:GntR family transcriptional regulator